MKKVTIFWFRRDLRLHDNKALFYALNSGLPVVPIFIFDKHILDQLSPEDSRVTFIHELITGIQKQLSNYNSSICVFNDSPIHVFKKLSSEYNIQNVFTNEDYDNYSIARDTKITQFLKTKDIDFQIFKDHVVFAKNDILKADNTPYLVFTPYMKAWRNKLTETDLKNYNSEDYLKNFISQKTEVISLSELGFIKSNIRVKPFNISEKLIQNYKETRNFPAIDGTSNLGPHLRFGTLSVRHLARYTLNYEPTFLNELVWRDFFCQILFHYPQSSIENFKRKYDAIEWRNNQTNFEAWCRGETGYPLVDAGMKELNITGYMSNRVRMVTASFLCKHLLIDWRWGEAYFARKLLDYDEASNIGNWQWVAGCGVDAAPYFRVFNPLSQQEKFDSNNKYVNTWLPNLNQNSYPKPIVNHKEARERCLQTYKKALQN